MNTNDIRNMNSNQDRFWIIALPLTLVTLTLILFVAYSGDGLRESFARIFSRRGRNQKRYASSALISFSEGKERSDPDLIDMATSSVTGEPHERFFSRTTEQQQDSFLGERYGSTRPQGRVGLTRGFGQTPDIRIQGRAETMPLHDMPLPYTVQHLSLTTGFR
jgi:hypothetical protein